MICTTPACAAAVRAAQTAQLRAALRTEAAGGSYAWHGAPRPAAGDSWLWHNFLGRALLGLGHWFGGVVRALIHLIERLLRWIVGRPAPVLPSSHGSISAWGWGLIALAAVLALLLAWYGLRRGPRGRARLGLSVATSPADFDTAIASDRPESEWLALCRQLEAAGDFRGALRASFLAGLAALATEQLIIIRRDRTNWEYERELRRRLRAIRSPAGSGELGDLFAAQAARFDQVWYGERALDRAALAEFVARQRLLMESRA